MSIVKTVTLMAAIERGEGASDTVVKGWLARALNVSRGPAWVCDNCQHIHAEWKPICSNCNSFDTLAWTTPPTSEVVMPGGVQMLPLIVGPAEDQNVTPQDEADVEIIDDVTLIEDTGKETAKPA